MKAFIAILILAGAAIFLTADLHDYPLPFWKAPHPAIPVGETALPWESFFGVFGIIYAILGGFLLIKVLERFSALSRSVEAEINALEDVRDYLIYFEPGQAPARRQVVSRLHAYLRSVMEIEWKSMAGHRRKEDRISSDTCHGLREVMAAVRDLKTDSYLEQTALQGIMNRLSDVTTHRTQRIGMAYERLPKSLKILLAFLSFILVIGFMLMPVSVPLLHLGMVVSVTVAAYLVFTIIQDLDQPFAGVWNISLTPLEDADAEFREQLAELDGSSHRAAALNLAKPAPAL